MPLAYARRTYRVWTVKHGRATNVMTFIDGPGQGWDAATDWFRAMRETQPSLKEARVRVRRLSSNNVTDLKVTVNVERRETYQIEGAWC